MGLVDYSESESDSENAPTAPAPKVQSGKKPFQKVVDRSNPGKIVVNLPQATSTTPADNEPPAKRARTEGSGGGRFSGFNSFLPPPKNANKPAAGVSSSGQTKPRPGVNLRTSAAPGFSRDGEEEEHGFGAEEGTSGGMTLPPPKKSAEPTIPEDQKAAEDVKLVGKPMMFKPLSVSRKKKPVKSAATKSATPKPATPATATQSPADASIPSTEPAKPAPPKKVSLFSIHTEEPSEPVTSATAGGVYEPLFETQGTKDDDYAQYAALAQSGPTPTTGSGAESLETIANDLNLSASERRELFGRGGGDGHAKTVKNFNMDEEYKHNEALRASGEEQVHNPVRAIQGGGKHSLRQLVHNVQNQREALEESFAKGKSNKKEAASRYGW